MDIRLSIAVFGLLSIAFPLTASAENPRPAPPASLESLRSLEQAGAYRYRMQLVDANGDKVVGLDGIAGKGLAMFTAPAGDEPGFSAMIQAVESKNGKIELQIDFSERTIGKRISEDQTNWMTSGFRMVDRNYELGESRVVTLADWKTSRPGPLQMKITVQPYAVDAD